MAAKGAATRIGGQAEAAMGELVRALSSDGAVDAAGLAGVRRAVVATLLRVCFLGLADAHGLLADASVRPLLSDLARRPPERSEASREAWPRLAASFRRVHEACGGELFAATVFERALPEVSDGVVYRVLSSLLELDGAPAPFEALGVELLGTVYEALMRWEVARGPGGELVLAPSEGRRRAGAHYTPRALTDRIARATLAPLLASPCDPTSLRVCDPAMGSGAFLVAACCVLGDAIASRWGRKRPQTPGPLARPGTSGVEAIGSRTRARPGSIAGEGATDEAARRARREAARRCLRGVDADPIAVELAKLSLWLVAAGPGDRFDLFDHALRCGDSLLDDAVAAQPALFDCAAAPSPNGGTRAAPFAWRAAFADVFAERGGFDAFVGNPPWISYVGRAAQPLDAATRSAFEAQFESFAGYKNMQGLFIERAATLLRPGGRLGFVVPSSMSEQGGYAPTRRAHDLRCACDDELDDLGEDAFEGVFQPCMALVSTRRVERECAPRGRAGAGAAPWPVARRDLDDGARALIARLGALPPLPPELFGERGVQTSSDDVEHMTRARDAAHALALRTGGDIAPFVRRPPSFFADPARLGRRARTAEEWGAVRVLLRQTARVPMAALADGEAFRNSILAGFETSAFPAAFLVAWMNAAPVRWLHYVRHRDARQGMPQVKIGHLRATPAPLRSADVEPIAAIGAELSRRNAPIDAAAQARLDAIVADALDLGPSDRDRIARWAAALT